MDGGKDASEWWPFGELVCSQKIGSKDTLQAHREVQDLAEGQNLIRGSWRTKAAWTRANFGLQMCRYYFLRP